MFTFNQQQVCIEFQNDQMKYSWSPDTFDMLIEETNGFIDCNNTFSINHDDNKVNFHIQYGKSGSSGTFNLTFQMTPEIRTSLEKALQELREYHHGTSVTDILCKIHRKV